MRSTDRALRSIEQARSDEHRARGPGAARSPGPRGRRAAPCRSRRRRRDHRDDHRDVRPGIPDAFDKIMQRGPTNRFLEPHEAQAMQRAVSCRTALALGGSSSYLLPLELDATINLVNTGALGTIRDFANVRSVNQNVLHLVNSLGVNAEWISEASEVTDASPTFTGPTVTCAKAGAYVEMSYEVQQDSNVSEQLGLLWADAKYRIEETAFCTGSGSDQPRGFSPLSVSSRRRGSRAPPTRRLEVSTCSTHSANSRHATRATRIGSRTMRSRC